MFDLQPARHSKLEKADILEMTVKHLENLQRQQVAMSAAADPSVLNKFRAGFSECAGEVGRFPGLEPAVKRRLLQHLATCLSGANPGGNTPTPQQATPTNTATGTVTVPVQPRQEQPTQLQVHILPTATAATATLDTHNGGIIFSNGAGTGVQLVPTRLPNGDIALVLPTAGHQAAALFRQQQQHQPQPQQQQQSASPPPMLVPIPTRTASTASASSATSSTSSGLSVPTFGAYSAPSSPEPDVRMLYSPPAQKPLSLVIRKTYQPVEEEKPWRPW